MQLENGNKDDANISIKPQSPNMFLYASPRFGLSLFMGIVDFALLFLYKEAYNLNSTLVGIGLMLGKIAIAICQFFFGWLSDHTNTRWGHRKPYLFILTPILAISFILLLIPSLFIGANPTTTILFTWFVCFNVLAQASYAVVTIYHAWTAELFPVYLRPKVSLRQNFLNFIGTALILIFAMIVLTDLEDRLKINPADISQSFIISIFIFAGILLFLMFFTAYKMPIEKTSIINTNLWHDLKILVKNRNFLYFCLLQGFCSFAWAMSQSTLLGFTEIVLDLEEFEYLIISAIMVIALILGLAFWRDRIEKWGKKRTLTRIFIAGIIILPFSFLGRFSFAINLPFAIFFIAGVAIALGGWYLFPYIIYADIAEDDERKTGKLRAGSYSGFSAILLNLFQAISLLFTGWILDLPGSIQNQPDSEAFSIGYLIWGPISALILIFSLFLLRKKIVLDFTWEKEKCRQVGKLAAFRSEY